MASDAGELVFWKSSTTENLDGEAIWKCLRNNTATPILETLDVQHILSELSVFWGQVNHAPPIEIDLPEQETAVVLDWSKKHLFVLYQGAAEQLMQESAGLLASMGLQCYDILTDQFYPPQSPPKFIGDEFNELLCDVTRDIQTEYGLQLLADAGFPQDPTRGHSSELEKLKRTDPDAYRILITEIMQKSTAYLDSQAGGKAIQRELVRRKKGKCD